MTPKISDSVEDETRELLETAVRDGYFEVPRKTTLLELAESHNMTDIEASERLRFGLDTIVRVHLNGSDADRDVADTSEKTDGHDDH